MDEQMMKQQQANMAGANMGGSLGALEMRLWSDLTDGEKINRLNETVQALQSLVGSLHEMVMQARGMVARHEHGALGQPLFPAHLLKP